MTSNCTERTNFDEFSTGGFDNWVKQNYPTVQKEYPKCDCGTPLISLGEYWTGMCLECYMELPEKERNRIRNSIYKDIDRHAESDEEPKLPTFGIVSNIIRRLTGRK
jgi:hypothetical protein